MVIDLTVRSDFPISRAISFWVADGGFCTMRSSATSSKVQFLHFGGNSLPVFALWSQITIVGTNEVFFFVERPRGTYLLGFGEDFYCLLSFTGQQYYKLLFISKEQFQLFVKVAHNFTVLNNTELVIFCECLFKRLFVSHTTCIRK